MIIGEMFALRFLYMLALVVWLGGMVVLGAVVAPSTFQVLQALQHRRCEREICGPEDRCHLREPGRGLRFMPHRRRPRRIQGVDNHRGAQQRRNRSQQLPAKRPTHSSPWN